MKKRGPLAGLAITGMVTLGWIRFCSGPAPEVTHAELRPPGAPGQPYVVTVEVKNRGFGEGEAAVIIHLKDGKAGVYTSRQNVDLDPHQTRQLAVPMYAPEGSTLSDVKAEYPPR